MKIQKTVEVDIEPTAENIAKAVVDWLPMATDQVAIPVLEALIDSWINVVGKDFDLNFRRESMRLSISHRPVLICHLEWEEGQTVNGTPWTACIEQDIRIFFPVGTGDNQ